MTVKLSNANSIQYAEQPLSFMFTLGPSLRVTSKTTLLCLNTNKWRVWGYCYKDVLGIFLNHIHAE